MELIEKFSIHLNGSKSQFILNNKAKNQSELCKICALQQDSAKVLMFLERSILFPSLYFCTTNYVLKTLSRKAIEVSKSNETLTIEFYRLILFFQLMESSISPRSKMFLESLSESAKTIMNDSYSNSKKNCSIISNANLNELDTKLIAEPKKIVIKNGIDLDQTKKSVSLLDLNRMVCGVCDERISSKKIMEKDRRVKYSRQCQHIYHFECYQRAPILRCQFCVIKD
uniref:RING-type domain-containing protein n=1 Tax=Sarcoptes scabiei TaxID=52283 RepID=A0A834RIG5_SARSC